MQPDLARDHLPQGELNLRCSVADQRDRGAFAGRLNGGDRSAAAADGLKYMIDTAAEGECQNTFSQLHTGRCFPGSNLTRPYQARCMRANGL